MNVTKTALQGLAGKVSVMFQVKKRDNGDSFWTVKDGSPKWITEMCLKAHHGMMPDDFKYDFIVEALDALKSYDDPDSIRDQMEADPYNSDRLKWLASNLTRADYVDDAVREFGVAAKDFDLFEAIGWGQYQEKCEVLDIVRGILEERIATDGEEGGLE